MTPDEAKEAAARAALEHVSDGMKIGLGTGSTAAKFVAGLGEMVADGLSVVCVPTSEATREQAESLNIPLTRLDEEPILDLTVDGADELSERVRALAEQFDTDSNELPVSDIWAEDIEHLRQRLNELSETNSW